MTRFLGPRKRLVAGAYHHHLVTDHARVRAYADAVARVVRDGDVVADLGAGSGLLAGVAARSGARRVLAVEGDAHAFTFLTRFVEANDLAGVVIPVQADAEAWTPRERVDVVVCEMMETGLMNEDQVPVSNHVHAKWPARPRALIPHAATLTVSLVAARDAYHDFRILLPRFERDPAAPAFERLTDAGAYHRADFRARGPLRVDAGTRVAGTATGTANAALLETVAHLAPGVDAGGSPDHASPLVLPLEAPVPVQAGAAFDVRVAYALGSVTGQISVEVAPA